MKTLQNNTFFLEVNSQGVVNKLLIKNDSDSMNWVINKDYLNSHGYEDDDKLFGQFSLVANNKVYDSYEINPAFMQQKDQRLEVKYNFEEVTVVLCYDLMFNTQLKWSIKVVNNSDKQELTVDSFRVWSSLAYIMFRDKDVNRNMSQSCAIFPHLSNQYSKIACVRRSNKGPHLGIYNTKGRLNSIGSFCRYQNLFLEQVSPSLDGCIFHSLELVNDRKVNQDWIYNYGNPIKLETSDMKEWVFTFMTFEDQDAFFKNGLELGNPVLDYTPVIMKDSHFSCTIQVPKNKCIKKAWIEEYQVDGCKKMDLTSNIVQESTNGYSLHVQSTSSGEKKFIVEFDDRSVDFVVFNVLESTKDIIEERVKFLCEKSYINREEEDHYSAFKPVSNQGESLGKVCLILTKNLLAEKNHDEIRKAENSAVFYIKNKWFEDGDLKKPKKLYGDFYRIFDLDYIAHVFYLLAKFNDDELQYHSARTYLQWATEVLILRFDKSMHQSQREKNETELCGVFSLYIEELLEDILKQKIDCKDKLLKLWDSFGIQVKNKSARLEGAITEHYYDNAGIGPSCETLSILGYKEEALRYGELLLANIGFSNDYRSQNPDRWWESLAYMIHSLWGGLVANSSLVAYEKLGGVDFLKSAYRSMMPVFLCYDWNVHSTDKEIQKGEAASTYCVTSPNYNKPKLSRNRFGQSVFIEDYKGLLGNATGDDWDMGEELVAYLKGFGIKTYLYEENGEVKCINGEITKMGDKYVIKSFAAYPKKYHFYDRNLSLIADENELLPIVVLDGDKFIKIGECCY
ncbi:hypothetical protein MUB24_07210 [Lederbergia sp. NSJ-179]|uniref:hypothetical protein n=1 Tax=Lederbergia sp. NSJ-179 TaxID=2931402 RepID=UPI001FD22021|nr:hypothetical protein [Lederbergia sp. NSJ-179]MCJ7840699.1 hypothetical protein [Lederbergia sp. NSJ-179]